MTWKLAKLAIPSPPLYALMLRLLIKERKITRRSLRAGLACIAIGRIQGALSVLETISSLQDQQALPEMDHWQKQVA